MSLSFFCCLQKKLYIYKTIVLKALLVFSLRVGNNSRLFFFA